MNCKKGDIAIKVRGTLNLGMVVEVIEFAGKTPGYPDITPHTDYWIVRALSGAEAEMFAEVRVDGEKIGFVNSVDRVEAGQEGYCRDYYLQPLPPPDVVIEREEAIAA